MKLNPPIDREENLGIDTSTKNLHQRLIKKDGTSNILRKGLNPIAHYNFYHKLVTISWPKFFLFIVFTYLLINAGFASLFYYLEYIGQTESTENFHPWIKMLFLSFYTATGSGYGQLTPVSLLMNIVSTVESFFGLMFFALVTGLLYGRFSKPSAKMFFSEKILIAPFKDLNILSFRLSNAKLGQLIEAEAELIISMVETSNSIPQRKFYNVKLTNSKMTFFTGSWTISHIIDKESPIYHLDNNDFKKKYVEFILLIKATDDTYGQTVHSRISYIWNEVEWNASYRPIVEISDNQKTTINIRNVGLYDKIDESK